jgi:hypothetical protein
MQPSFGLDGYAIQMENVGYNNNIENINPTVINIAKNYFAAKSQQTSHILPFTQKANLLQNKF